MDHTEHIICTILEILIDFVQWREQDGVVLCSTADAKHDEKEDDDTERYGHLFQSSFLHPFVTPQTPSFYLPGLLKERVGLADVLSCEVLLLCLTQFVYLDSKAF